MSWIWLQLHIAVTYYWRPRPSALRLGGVSGGAPGKHTKRTALGGEWVGDPGVPAKRTKLTALGGGWVEAKAKRTSLGGGEWGSPSQAH